MDNTYKGSICISNEPVSIIKDNYGIVVLKTLLDNLVLANVMKIMEEKKDEALAAATLNYIFVAAEELCTSVGPYIPHVSQERLVDAMMMAIGQLSTSNYLNLIDSGHLAYCLNHVYNCFCKSGYNSATKDAINKCKGAFAEVRHYVEGELGKKVGYTVASDDNNVGITLGNALMAKVCKVGINYSDDLRCSMFANILDNDVFNTVTELDTIAKKTLDALRDDVSCKSLIEGANYVNETSERQIKSYISEVISACSNSEGLKETFNKTNFDLDCYVTENLTLKNYVPDVTMSNFGWMHESIVMGTVPRIHAIIEAILGLREGQLKEDMMLDKRDPEFNGDVDGASIDQNKPLTITGKNLQYVLGAAALEKDSKNRKLIAERLAEAVINTINWESTNENYSDLPAITYLNRSQRILETLTKNTGYYNNLMETWNTVSDRLMEGVIFNGKDKAYKFDEWKPQKGKNILFITGLDGSFTKAYQLSAEYDAVVFHTSFLFYDEDRLDYIEEKDRSGLSPLLHEVRTRCRLSDARIGIVKWQDMLKKMLAVVIDYANKNPDTMFVVQGRELSEIADMKELYKYPNYIMKPSDLKILLNKANMNGIKSIPEEYRRIKHDKPNYKQYEKNLKSNLETYESTPECVTQGVFNPTPTISEMTPMPVGTRSFQLAFNELWRAETDEEIDLAMFEFIQAYTMMEGRYALTFRNWDKLMLNMCDKAHKTGDYSKVQERLLKIVDSCRTLDEINYLRHDLDVTTLEKYAMRVKQVEDGNKDELERRTARAIQKQVDKGMSSKNLEQHCKWLRTTYREAINTKAKELRDKKKASISEGFNDYEDLQESTIIRKRLPFTNEDSTGVYQVKQRIKYINPILSKVESKVRSAIRKAGYGDYNEYIKFWRFKTYNTDVIDPMILTVENLEVEVSYKECAPRLNEMVDVIQKALEDWAKDAPGCFIKHTPSHKPSDNIYCVEFSVGFKDSRSAKQKAMDDYTLTTKGMNAFLSESVITAIMLEASAAGKAARKVSREVQKKQGKVINKQGGALGEVKAAVKNAVDPMEKYIGQMLQKAKKADADERREILIKGGVLPKVRRWLKRSIGLIAGAAVGTTLPVAATITGITLIGFIATDKMLDAKEKRKLLRELDDEIAIVNEKIDDSRSDENKQNKYELMRIRNELQRTRERIILNLKE